LEIALAQVILTPFVTAGNYRREGGIR
jgi:hypothetical protein